MAEKIERLKEDIKGYRDWLADVLAKAIETRRIARN